MGRIRTIKPEFCQSESMGRVTREARLLFILLFTIVDDEGRTRAASRMLASHLFPYDDDAPIRLPEWMAELERQGCVSLYRADGNSYLEIVKWKSHQRIDKPTKSRLPAPPSHDRSPETSENAPEVSRPLQDHSSLDREGKGKDQEGEEEGIIARSAGADELTRACEIYNRIAQEVGWPEVQRLTNARKSKLTQRLAECGGIAGWQNAMAKARASSFLRGTTGRRNGHEKWAPDFDFFIQQASFTKLMEGKYDDRNSNSEPTGYSAVLAGARAAASG